MFTFHVSRTTISSLFPLFPKRKYIGKIETLINSDYFWLPGANNTPLSFYGRRIKQAPLSTLAAHRESIQKSSESSQLPHHLACFSLVRDYHSIYPPKGKDDLEDSSDFEKKRKCFLKKVCNVFEQSDLQELVGEFNAAEPLSQDILDRSILLSNQLKMERVKFRHGKVSHRALSQYSYYKNSTSLVQKAIRIAMERFAGEIECKDEVIKMTCSAIKYRLVTGEALQNSVQWHTDYVLEKMYAPADYTMLVLLSDPYDSDFGWSGGNLLYTGRREIKWFNGLDQLKNRTKNGVTNHPEFPIWEIQPTPNVRSYLAMWE
jgi:hypothetical protein